MVSSSRVRQAKKEKAEKRQGPTRKKHTTVAEAQTDEGTKL